MTALFIALTIAAALAAGGIAITGAIETNEAKNSNKSLSSWLKEQYPELTDEQIRGIITEYGDAVPSGFADFGKWGDQTDLEGLQRFLDDLYKAQEKIGEKPNELTEEDLLQIQEEAYRQIDEENSKIANLYRQSYEDASNVLKNEMLESNAAFSDYRNQVLTSGSMAQQAIAGSVRFELERQQRNAITRGASAAQRLVANINTQLGLQAQSAQQSLDTSNALAQSLLAQRQAQQGLRTDYLNATNQYNNNMANLLSGQTERRTRYGQERKQDAISDNQYAWDLWNQRITDSGLSTLGQGIYRSGAMNNYSPGQTSSYVSPKRFTGKENKSQEWTKPKYRWAM